MMKTKTILQMENDLDHALSSGTLWLYTVRMNSWPETLFTEWKGVRVVKFASIDDDFFYNEVCWIILLNLSKILHRKLSPYFESVVIHQSLSLKNVPFRGDYVALTFTELPDHTSFVKTHKFIWCDLGRKSCKCKSFKKEIFDP